MSFQLTDIERHALEANGVIKYRNDMTDEEARHNLEAKAEGERRADEEWSKRYEWEILETPVTEPSMDGFPFVRPCPNCGSNKLQLYAEHLVHDGKKYRLYSKCQVRCKVCQARSVVCKMSYEEYDNLRKSTKRMPSYRTLASTAIGAWGNDSMVTL